MICRKTSQWSQSPTSFAYNGRYRDNGYHPLVASFTDGRMMDFLTDEKARFLGRLKSNPVLDRLAEPHLKRPVGRPPREGYEDVIDLGPYRAEPGGMLSD